MHLLNSKTQFTWTFHEFQTVSQKYQLSASTRYYICKLLRQVPACESANLVEFTYHLSKDDCSCLNQILQETYTDEAECVSVFLQLDNLVYLHRSLLTQLSLYPEYALQLMQIKQRIFRLLGYQEN